MAQTTKYKIPINKQQMVSICQIKCYNMGIDKNRHHFDTVTVLKGEKMNTLETTISMLEVLPETDLMKVQDFTEKLFRMREFEAADEAVGKFLKPMSREDFMRDIEVAEQEIADEKYSRAEEVFNELEHRYGL